ncbi:MAG TPA: hypothetical protein DIT64_06280 [Verrucomicrobiales bacterium]|nr:hypothetical protein [Verrucomicrobiales bacterium]HCN77886.1 hypothetical protein [Verrucomicrobiales bacterium]HRJ09161.1 hypothetical protein [Prosthecobacter sp.]HRK12989.1 hypothetical protein [Prosthecobacter sp.]
MSFDPAFLTNTRDPRREREDEMARAWLRARLVRKCHRAATGIMIAAMAAIALPWLGVSAFAWWIASGAAVVMLALAVVMFVQGGVSSGIITLVCALAALPLWVHFSPQVFLTGVELWEMLSSQWRESLERP